MFGDQAMRTDSNRIDVETLDGTAAAIFTTDLTVLTGECAAAMLAQLLEMILLRIYSAPSCETPAVASAHQAHNKRH